jgi:hypothetical protein
VGVGVSDGVGVSVGVGVTVDAGVLDSDGVGVGAPGSRGEVRDLTGDDREDEDAAAEERNEVVALTATGHALLEGLASLIHPRALLRDARLLVS